jgi:hypothetical protein
MKIEEYQRIISNAIDREVESYSFYRTVSGKVKDPSLKVIFAELAEEETKHRTYLQSILTIGRGAMRFSGPRITGLQIRWNLRFCCPP